MTIGLASSNPLADWTNDDLMLTEDARRMVAEAFPQAFRILDWPELREEFYRHDVLANEAKKKVNHHGVSGAFLSALGASMLSVAPVFPGGLIQSAGVVAGCTFVLVGGLMGLWHLIGHSGRAKWLVERLWTERLRQFYFQYVINNFEGSLSAMEDNFKLDNYRILRDGALKIFIEDTKKSISARSPIQAIKGVADDFEDARLWGQSVWQATPSLSDTNIADAHRELFECLSHGRIGIQELYAQLSLKPKASNAGSMAKYINICGNIATLIFVVFLTMAGCLILWSSGHASMYSNIIIALSGVAAAWGLYFRLVDQGMGYSLDAERYKLYAEQVELVRQRYNAATDNAYLKIIALRQLELYAYREMRQFLRTHLRSRFLG